MKPLVWITLSFLLSSSTSLLAQDVQWLIAAVRQKQATLKSLTYTLSRTDTLVTGTVRHLRGRATIRPDRADRLFGFWFRGKEDQAGEVIYDGRVGYQVEERTKTYARLVDSTQIRALLYHPGGRIIVPDLIKLDTTKAIRFSVSQDKQFYYLTMHYADLKQYDVLNRYKTLGIDRTTLLPMYVRQHQETLGKVQDLRYRIQSVTFDESIADRAFQDPTFLHSYQPKQAPISDHKPGQHLIGQPAPAFHLPSLQGDSLSSSTFLGKVTLLDFWEVWCEPCLVSMPNVKQLNQQYSNRGFQVYGITHEIQQLNVARQLVTKRSIDFPTLIGNKQVRSDYRLGAIPLYVLIDRQGRIRLVSEGFSEAIEPAIQQLLNQ